MKLIFYKASKGTLLDKVIAWWTSSYNAKTNGSWKDSYSHVELQFSDGACFSASPRDGVTRFKSDIETVQHWDVVPLGASMETGMKAWCTAHSGKRYDYAGVLGFAINIRQDQDKWFCSEVCTYVLQAANYREVDGLMPSKTSPNALARSFGLLKD